MTAGHLRDRNSVPTLGGNGRAPEDGGTMDGDELQAALDRIGISQREAARRLRVSDRAVRYWIAGDREIPGPVEALVECWLTKEAEGTDE